MMAVELAGQRNAGSLIGFAVHHAGFNAPAKGAVNMEELLKRAASYDAAHSFKDYSTPKNGTNDAKFTGAELGYKWILYHVMIARNGDTLYLQDWKWVRYHATDNWRLGNSLNLHGGAILLDGNFEYETPTEEQIQAAAKVVYDYEKAHNERGLIVLGHRETSGPSFPTSCPGAAMGTSAQGNVQRIRAIATAMHLDATPPSANYPRLDVLAEVERWATKNRDRVTNVDRKDEWSRLVSYTQARSAELS